MYFINLISLYILHWISVTSTNISLFLTIATSIRSCGNFGFPLFHVSVLGSVGEQVLVLRRLKHPVRGLGGDWTRGITADCVDRRLLPHRVNLAPLSERPVARPVTVESRVLGQIRGAPQFPVLIVPAEGSPLVGALSGAAVAAEEDCRYH